MKLVIERKHEQLSDGRPLLHRHFRIELEEQDKGFFEQFSASIIAQHKKEEYCAGSLVSGVSLHSENEDEVDEFEKSLKEGFKKLKGDLQRHIEKQRRLGLA